MTSAEGIETGISVDIMYRQAVNSNYWGNSEKNMRTMNNSAHTPLYNIVCVYTVYAIRLSDRKTYYRK